MGFFGIAIWDWAALGLYLVGITVIGVWAIRRVRTTAGFFIGDRRFGKTFMVFFAFGAGTNGNQAVAVAAKTYTNGLSGIWYQWLWLFATPFYWLIAPTFRRMRAVTTGDYFEHRYGGYTDALYAIAGPLQLIINIGIMLLGTGALVEAITAGAINRHVAIAVMTALFVVYGVAGGLAAAIVTDFIQGVLTILLSFLLLPFALRAVGGFHGLHEHIQDPSMFSLVVPGELDLFYVVMFAVNALVGIVVQPHTMGTCAAGRDEMDGRIGFAGGNILKRICTIAWMLTGLCAVVMYTGLQGNEADRVYGLMARDLLPNVFPGLIGVFLASLLASVMSSCDAFMVASSGLFTQNLYRKYIAPGRDDRHYMFVGRVASIAIVAGSLWFAYNFQDVASGLEVFWMISAMMGAGFWIGLFWRRATPQGVWAGTLLAFAVMLLTGKIQLGGFTLWDFNARFAASLPDFMLYNGALKLPWQMVFYLVAAFVSCILVSLMTPPVPKEKLDRFYACLRTPIQPGERDSAPFTLPPGVTPPEPNRLIELPGFEIPKPTFTGIAGFAALWLVAGLMIGFVRWMFTWGV